jgi:hypothetical protein
LLGTLITSFPNAWDNEQPYSLKHKLDEEIQKNKQRNPISSIDYLVHLIIKLSVDFLRREGPSGIKFQEAFQESINDIVSELDTNGKNQGANGLPVGAREETIQMLQRPYEAA